MASIADAPEIVLLNEKQIENLYSYINEGTIKEIVENSRETETGEIGIGIKKLIQLQFGSTSEDETSEETVRNIDTVGKFAILHQNLDESGDITRVDELDEDTRSQLEDRQYIETKGEITNSPVNNIQDAMDQIVPLIRTLGMGSEMETGQNDIGVDEIQQFVDEVNTRGDRYIQDVSSDALDSSLIFSLDGLVSEVGQDFPARYTEYRVLSSIEHVFEEGESESLVEVANMVPEGRNKKDRMQFISGLADMASEVTNRDVSVSDMEISYPDIRVRPMAIYLT